MVPCLIKWRGTVVLSRALRSLEVKESCLLELDSPRIQANPQLEHCKLFLSTNGPTINLKLDT